MQDCDLREIHGIRAIFMLWFQPCTTFMNMAKGFRAQGNPAVCLDSIGISAILEGLKQQEFVVCCSKEEETLEKDEQKSSVMLSLGPRLRYSL